ncbi:MAG: hypothetical protein IJ336_05955 [Lachnospiraceae bacterium]|nr:hypothetical protein [Lachnospiraceae bacterium]
MAYIVGWAFFAAVYYLVSPIISVVVNLAIAAVVWIFICAWDWIMEMFRKGKKTK